jgi:hypothetical protein
MSSLINECDKLNVNHNSYSGSEEHFSTAEELLAEQSTSDGEPSTFLEPPVEFNSEAPTKYGRRACPISKKSFRECLNGTG